MFYLLTGATEGIDAVMAILNTYILPIVNSILVTVVPSITPWLINKINSKILGVTTDVNKAFNDISATFTTSFSKIQGTVEQLTLIPDKIQTYLIPVFNKLDETTSMMVLLAENSRIPLETKQVFKNMHASVGEASTKTTEYLQSLEKGLTTANKTIEELQQKITSLTTVQSVVSPSTEKSKSSKTKTTKKTRQW